MRRAPLEVEQSVKRHAALSGRLFLNNIFWACSLERPGIERDHMTALRLVVTLFSLSPYLLAQGHPSRLEGCPDPAKVARGLKALQQQKWVNLSPKDLDEIWPKRYVGEGRANHIVFW